MSHFRYSYPLLKLAFAFALLLFFVVVLRHLLLLPRRMTFERADRRTDLAQSQITPGLNVDSLPLVKIDYGQYRPTSDTPGGGGDESIGAAQRRQLCLTRGLYVGPENTTDDINCSTMCNVDAQEVQYTYVTNIDTRRIIAGRQPVRPGGYCMPTLMATCNRNTSSVVYSMNGWTCVPRTDAFAGEGGNRIVVCNGSLRDNALRTVYRDFIPPNLVFTNVYTDRLADGTYRFECPHRERDVNGNLYVESQYNRLHRLRNWCTQDIPYASGASVNLSKAECVCGQELHLDEFTGRCVACRVGFDASTKQIAFASRPCYSFTDTVQQFEERLNDLRVQIEENEKEGDEETVLDLHDRTIFPCGYNNQGSSSERTLARCLTYNVALYQPALPSHNTLNVIDTLAGG